MSKLYIQGGQALHGEVKISGCKNEVLKIIASSVCIKGTLKIKNVPKISDVMVMLEILEKLGAKYKFDSGYLELNSDNLKNGPIDQTLAGKLRASIVLIGPFLARFGEIAISYPGGDMIGARQIDTHLDAFANLGAEIKKSDHLVELKIKHLKSRSVTLNEKSVTATENMILFAAATDGEIEINNCAIEPEILHLCEFLKSCGASIERLERSFKVKGNKNLTACEFVAMPDRIEAGTYITAFLATKGSGKLIGVNPENMRVIIDFFTNIGAQIEEGLDYVEVKESPELRSFKISTGVFPGFPSDMQAPLSVLASVTEGASEVEENLYKNRFNHLVELGKLGLEYKLIDENHAQIFGPSKLKGAMIDVSDLRAGATAVLAGLVAEGETIVNGIEIIERGYEDIDKKLNSLGAQIRKYDK